MSVLEDSLEECLGIAGWGTIACGLAATAARSCEVLLWARSADSAERARERVERTCGKVEVDLDPSRVRIVTDLDALGEAPLLLEAVVEDHAEKAALLAALARHAGHDAVLATTTSSLSIASLASAAGRPSR